MKNSIKNAEERMEHLYEEAVGRYLNKTDFDPTSWMSDDEATEYMTLNHLIDGE